MNLISRQSQSKQMATAWLLIGMIMLQPVITFLASPAFMNDSDGRMVVVCTLYGLEEIYVEDGMQKSEAESDYCPAVELMQISGSAYQPKPPMVAAALFYSIGSVDQTSTHEHHSLHYSAYQTRAPPVA
ncbi:hypothetical protein BOW49_01610 [Solemya velum gill symbiont]|nr:hypothetical protein BOW49_01610 [Solemya velum gill symbiont]